jgi:thioredoxin reductase (NADPH)
MEPFDVAIVGAGPIGLELAVALKRFGVRYVHFDAHQIGHTISWWPRETHFFSTSERVAIAGIPIQSVHHQRITGEEYLAYLRGIVEQFDLQINTYEPVKGIEKDGDWFTLRTDPAVGPQVYQARYVVLAKGDMDKPNVLGIPGEDLEHVTHYFDRPHRYFRKRLLIVGGRNSAVEAALRCWRAGAQVTLSYRRSEFDRRSVKKHILPDLLTQIRKGNIGFLPASVPVSISPGYTVLQSTSERTGVAGDRTVHHSDFVLLCTGFVQEMSLYRAAGVQLDGPERIPAYDATTMETNVPGLFIAGTTAAGNQGRYTLFIENTHHHVAKIVAAITGRRDVRIGTIASRTYELLLSEIRDN